MQTSNLIGCGTAVCYHRALCPGNDQRRMLADTKMRGVGQQDLLGEGRDSSPRSCRRAPGVWLIGLSSALVLSACSLCELTLYDSGARDAGGAGDAPGADGRTSDAAGGDAATSDA